MICFGYPLDIHGWKTKPDQFRGPEPENRGRKTTTKTKTAGSETHGYPNQNRPAAILRAWRTSHQGYDHRVL